MMAIGIAAKNSMNLHGKRNGDMYAIGALSASNTIIDRNPLHASMTSNEKFAKCRILPSMILGMPIVVIT